MLVQTMNAITRRFQNVRGPAPPGPAGQPGDRSAAPAQQPALGLHPGRAAPAERRAPQLRVRPPVRAAARRPRGPGHAARPTRARSSSRRSTTCCACARCSTSRTTTPRSRRTRSRVLNALKEVHLILIAGRAQPVRRPAVDRADRDADAAVAAGAAGVPRVPADARHGRLPGAVDGPRRRDEDAPGMDRHQRAALPQPRGVRRADPPRRSATAPGARRRAGRRRSTGRASGGRRFRATSTPTAPSPASSSAPRSWTRGSTPRCPRCCCRSGWSRSSGASDVSRHARLHVIAVPRVAARVQLARTLGGADARPAGGPAGSRPRRSSRPGIWHRWWAVRQARCCHRPCTSSGICSGC